MSQTSSFPLITIEIADEFLPCITPNTIQEVVKTSLSHLSIPQAISLTVVITDDHQVHHLNHQFRKIDSPTDVLSFPAGYEDPDSGTTYLGDVILSYPRAEAQAKEHTTSITDEIRLLVVHGILHLLDYDHATAIEKKRMWAVQNAILQELGITAHIDAPD